MDLFTPAGAREFYTVIFPLSLGHAHTMFMALIFTMARHEALAPEPLWTQPCCLPAYCCSGSAFSPPRQSPSSSTVVGVLTRFLPQERGMQEPFVQFAFESRTYQFKVLPFVLLEQMSRCVAGVQYTTGTQPRYPGQSTDCTGTSTALRRF